MTIEVCYWSLFPKELHTITICEECHVAIHFLKIQNQVSGPCLSLAKHLPSVAVPQFLHLLHKVIMLTHWSTSLLFWTLVTIYHIIFQYWRFLILETFKQLLLTVKLYIKVLTSILRLIFLFVGLFLSCQQSPLYSYTFTAHISFPNSSSSSSVVTLPHDYVSSFNIVIVYDLLYNIVISTSNLPLYNCSFHSSYPPT